jgi:hypothetical protein
VARSRLDRAAPPQETRRPSARVLAGFGDTVGVSRFTDQAYEILEAAEFASQRGLVCSEWTVLVSQEGAIRMIADTDWPLDNLAVESRAKAAYRVKEGRGSVRVEACSGSRTCTMESKTPRQAARLLLGSSC